MPIALDLAGLSYAGTGRLEHGHISGRLQVFGKPVNMTGDIKDNWLTVELVGALDPHSSVWAGDCMATGKAYQPMGQVTMPMLAGCAATTPRVVLHLDMPAS